jgi:hypothetical protein
MRSLRMRLLDERKSEFINYLVKSDQYITLALLAQCTFEVVEGKDTFQSLAGLVVDTENPPHIVIHKYLLEHGTQWEFNTVMLHELRHIPQLVYAHSLWSSVDYPAWIDTEEKMKSAWKQVANPAMDMSLHEDLKNLLGKDLQDKMQRVIKGFIQDVLGEEPGTEKLGAFAYPDMKSNMDTAYYASELLKRAEEPPESQDHHDFGDGEGDGTGEEAGAMAAKMADLMQRAEAEGASMAYKAGREASDSAIKLNKDPLQDRIKKAIQAIKVSVNRIAQGKATSRYNWSRMNKHWPGMPGRTFHVEHSQGVFFVADTSGSMCTPKILNQLIPALDELKRKAMIVGAYACDVELSPFDRTVKGGGGTELSARHAAELRKLHGLKPETKIDIVYVTDGEVWGLETLQKDPTVKLHTIIV